MNGGNLDGDYYRRQADLCVKLAASAHAAKPLHVRLCRLAESYRENARTADASVLVRQATGKLLDSLRR